jgi:hypothetical protein
MYLIIIMINLRADLNTETLISSSITLISSLPNLSSKSPTYSPQEFKLKSSPKVGEHNGH